MRGTKLSLIIHQKMGLLQVRPWSQKGVRSPLEAAVVKHQQRHTGSVDRLGVERNSEEIVKTNYYQLQPNWP